MKFAVRVALGHCFTHRCLSCGTGIFSLPRPMFTNLIERNREKKCPRGVATKLTLLRWKRADWQRETSHYKQAHSGHCDEATIRWSHVQKESFTPNPAALINTEAPNFFSASTVIYACNSNFLNKRNSFILSGHPPWNVKLQKEASCLFLVSES